MIDMTQPTTTTATETTVDSGGGCAIIGSLDPMKLKRLYTLNTKTNSTGYSLYVYDLINKRIRFSTKQLGAFDPNTVDQITNGLNLNDDQNYYIIASHTEQLTYSKIHPACIVDNGDLCYFWHSGTLDQNTITMLQEDLDTTSNWDTQLFAMYMIRSGNISNLNGNFACLMYRKGDIFMFRDQNTPLYIDEDMNISTTKFNNSYKISPNFVFKCFLQNKTTNIVSSFRVKTTQNQMDNN